MLLSQLGPILLFTSPQEGCLLSASSSPTLAPLHYMRGIRALPARTAKRCRSPSGSRRTRTPRSPSLRALGLTPYFLATSPNAFLLGALPPYIVIIHILVPYAVEVGTKYDLVLVMLKLERLVVLDQALARPSSTSLDFLRAPPLPRLGRRKASSSQWPRGPQAPSSQEYLGF